MVVVLVRLLLLHFRQARRSVRRLCGTRPVRQRNARPHPADQAQSFQPRQAICGKVFAQSKGANTLVKAPNAWGPQRNLAKIRQRLDQGKRPVTALAASDAEARRPHATLQLGRGFVVRTQAIGVKQAHDLVVQGWQRHLKAEVTHVLPEDVRRGEGMPLDVANTLADKLNKKSYTLTKNNFESSEDKPPVRFRCFGPCEL